MLSKDYFSHKGILFSKTHPIKCESESAAPPYYMEKD